MDRTTTSSTYNTKETESSLLSLSLSSTSSANNPDYFTSLRESIYLVK